MQLGQESERCGACRAGDHHERSRLGHGCPGVREGCSSVAQRLAGVPRVGRDLPG
jgi:hypothetical protein